MQQLTPLEDQVKMPTVKNQNDFFDNDREFAPNRIAHGDKACIDKRKIARPFRRNCATHLVLKSELAKGALNLRTARNRIAVDRIVGAQSRKFGVKIHASQNVGNHLHFVLSCGLREGFQNFLRAVTGLIARTVTDRKFWTQPPFTRLITGRRDYLAMLNYIEKNTIEAVFGKVARTNIEAAEDAARRTRRRDLAKSRRKNSA